MTLQNPKMLKVNKIHFIFLYLLSTSLTLYSQNSITLQPDASVGKDVHIASRVASANNNYATANSLIVERWTIFGELTTWRSLIQFDVSAVPADARIINANLTLYGINHDPLTQPNTTLLQRVSLPWDETTITWNNQPATTNVGQIVLASTTSQTQNNVIDVTAHLQDMVLNPSTNYGWCLKLQNEIDTYTARVYASSDHTDASKWPKLEINYFVLAVSPNVTICQSTSTNLVASGAATYSWSPSTGLNTASGSSVIANPATTTTYTVTGTINGVSTSKQVTVTVNLLPTLVVTPISPTICLNCLGQGSMVLTASGASSYLWTPAAGLSATNIANPTASPTTTSNYLVTGTDANGCSNSLSTTVTVKQLQSDSNHDGKVSNADLSILLAEWNKTCSQ